MENGKTVEGKEKEEKEEKEKEEEREREILLPLLRGEELQRVEEEIPEKEILNQIVFWWDRIKGDRIWREQQWLDYFDAYNMRDITLERKGELKGWEWRSKTVPPKQFYIIEQFVSTLRKGLQQSQNFFKVSSSAEELAPLAIVLERLVRHYLKSFNFLEEFERALKIGAITGEIIMKVNWKTEIREVGTQVLILGFPHFQALSPFDIVVDDAERFAIERYFLDFVDVYQLQRLGIWRKFPVKEFSPPMEVEEQAQRVQFQIKPPRENMVEVLEFWGNLYFQDKIIEKVHIIIVNREHLALIENYLSFDPHPIPYIKSHIIEPIKGQYGMGLYDLIFKVLEGYNITWRYLEDNIHLSLATALEVDKSRVDPKTQQKFYEEGFDPFMVILKTGEEQVLKPVSYSTFNPNVLPLIQLYNQEIQNATGITEFLMGLPTSKGRPTATEVKLKTSQNIAVMDLISIRIENMVISRIIRKLLHLILQNEEPEKIMLLVGETGWKYLQTFEKEQLHYLIESKLAISVSGISEVLHRSEKLEKLINFVEIAKDLGINMNYVVKKLAEFFDFLPEEILAPPPTEEEIQAQTQSLSIIMSIQDEGLRRDFLELFGRIPATQLLQVLQILLQTQQQKR